MKDQQLYWVWAAMIQRCTNPANPSYADYGGRGICVCERWRKFENFASDMAPRPAGHLLDRRDNNGDYEPGNCRWVTRCLQNSNRRNCLYVFDAGEEVTLREYCRRHALAYRPIVKRIQNRGWSVEQALSIPVGQKPHTLRRLKGSAA